MGLCCSGVMVRCSRPYAPSLREDDRDLVEWVLRREGTASAPYACVCVHACMCVYACVQDAMAM